MAIPNPATVDPMAGAVVGLNSPASQSFPITPGSAFTDIPRQIHCGGNAGTVVGFLMGDNVNGTANTFYIPQGGTLSYRFIVILNTSTATGLVGVY